MKGRFHIETNPNNTGLFYSFIFGSSHFLRKQKCARGFNARSDSHFTQSSFILFNDNNHLVTLMYQLKHIAYFAWNLSTRILCLCYRTIIVLSVLAVTNASKRIVFHFATKNMPKHLGNPFTFFVMMQRRATTLVWHYFFRSFAGLNSVNNKSPYCIFLKPQRRWYHFCD